LLTPGQLVIAPQVEPEKAEKEMLLGEGLFSEIHFVAIISSVI